MRMRPAFFVPLLLAIVVGPSVAQTSCPATAPDMLGPFYTAGAPERGRTGDGLVVAGVVRCVVRSTQECRALSGAKLEWWSANARGEYDDAHRATQVADSDGRFRYVTDMPGKYPGRPVHVHVKITASGHKILVTQVYPKPGQSAITTDFVLQPD
jgi:protocatechuate 3,4-dioxygenase beta subunit